MAPRKRVSNGPPLTRPAPKKRACNAPSGSSSQPIPILETQPDTLSSSSHKALPDAPKASQATSTFESQLRDNRPEAEI
ncbi:hypothetical protein CC86DRAFT_246807, partial [Ophiobolus disseminans]